MRRPIFLASAALVGLLALYSCSMRAALATDGDGRVVKVSSLRLESSLVPLALALELGSRVAVELRWIRGLDPTCGEKAGAEKG